MILYDNDISDHNWAKNRLKKIVNGYRTSTPSSSTASAQQLIPQQQLYQPPVRAGPKCFACGQFGHIQLYCPMKNIKKE